MTIEEVKGLKLEPAVIKAVADISEIFTRFELTQDEQELAQYPVVNAYVAGMETNGTKKSVGFQEEIYIGLARQRVIKSIKRD